MVASFFIRAGSYAAGGLDGSESDGTNLLSTGFPGFTAGWTTEDVTLTAAATASPSGSTDAASVVENGSNTRHDIYYTHSGAAIGTCTASAYMKAFGRRYAVIQLADDGGNGFQFYADLQDGLITDTEVFGTGSISSTSIAAAVNGFYKVSASGSFGASETGDRYFTIALSNVATYGAPLSNELPQYTGDGTSGIYVWRGKLVND